MQPNSASELLTEFCDAIVANDYPRQYSYLYGISSTTYSKKDIVATYMNMWLYDTGDRC